jgi:hypothetical protein
MTLGAGRREVARVISEEDDLLPTVTRVMELFSRGTVFTDK